ncbi:MAG: hypothetical protein J0L86_13525 [Flavobacteriales bacterium]|nr:hypothetical protein [Flavobacteriales bacterium]
MKKGVIIAFVALATSLAVFAGVNNTKANEKAKTECCDKTDCCLNGTETEVCCDNGCE